MLKLKVLLLVLLASPLLAAPPVVLLLTVALPEFALWVFTLLTVMLLVLDTVDVLLTVALVLLSELGPVLVMLP
jgi:hypothetical protein